MGRLLAACAAEPNSEWLGPLKIGPNYLGRRCWRLREWLITNGLGGFASATIAGGITLHGCCGIAAAAVWWCSTISSSTSSVPRSQPSRARSIYRLYAGHRSAELGVWIDGMVLEKSIVLASGHDLVVDIPIAHAERRAGACGCDRSSISARFSRRSRARPR